jgi:hypothetical protein
MRWLALPLLLVGCAARPEPPAPVAAPEEPPLPGRVLPLTADVPTGGMGLGPALALVRPVPLGTRVDLAVAGVPIQVENRSHEPQRLRLGVADPARAGLVSWERGYEAPPDLAWFTVDPATFTVPPRSRLLASLALNIPDRPELANQHWCLAVVLAPEAAQGIGAGLALAGRLQIETEARAGVVPGGSAFGVAPSVVAPAGELRLSLAGTAARRWQVLPLAGVIPDATRQVRYRASDRRAVAGWSAPQPAEGRLEPGGSVTIRWSGGRPAGMAGPAAEEVWFVVDPDTLADPQPVCVPLRIHHPTG